MRSTSHAYPIEDSRQEQDPAAPLVLVVDDDHYERRHYTRQLERRGYRIEEADNGRDGIERARATMPDVVLMARSMPLLDGVATAKALKRDPRTGSIPIIMLTGYWSPDCDAHFERGRSVAELHDVIRALRARPPRPRR